MGQRDVPQNASPGQDAAEAESGFSLVSNRKLKDLYAAMVRMRMLEERARSNPGQGTIPAGREAIAAAIAVDLLPGDRVLASPQNVLPGFLRGMPVEAILEHFGFTCCHGRIAQGGFSLEKKPLEIEASVKSRIENAVAGRTDDETELLVCPADAAVRFNHAVNLALAAKVRGGSHIAVVFADAREMGSASTQAALSFAGAQELPLIFVCDSMDLAGRSRTKSCAERAKSRGVPGIAVDGNDAVAVYRVAYESISRARRGRGPTLIECRSFRLEARRGSTVVGSEWAGRAAFCDDPLAQMEEYLRNKGIFREEEKAAVQRSFLKELDQVADKAREAAG